MIQDSKFVKSVKSNAPKKGWKVEWHDGKYDNFFDEAWLPILSGAQESNRMVHFTKDKNQAGYWNLLTIELATETPPPVPKEGMPPKETKAPMPVDNKTRSVALSYAKDLANNGMILMGHIGVVSSLFERYCNGEIDATQLDTNLKAILK